MCIVDKFIRLSEAEENCIYCILQHQFNGKRTRGRCVCVKMLIVIILKKKTIFKTFFEFHKTILNLYFKKTLYILIRDVFLICKYIICIRKLMNLQNVQVIMNIMKRIRKKKNEILNMNIIRIWKWERVFWSWFWKRLIYLFKIIYIFIIIIVTRI